MNPETRALILYAYGLGGNTREIARLTGISHDDVADALAKAAHDDAMAAVDRTHEPWCMETGKDMSQCCGGNLLDGMEGE